MILVVDLLFSARHELLEALDDIVEVEVWLVRVDLFLFFGFVGLRLLMMMSLLLGLLVVVFLTILGVFGVMMGLGIVVAHVLFSFLSSSFILFLYSGLFLGSELVEGFDE